MPVLLMSAMPIVTMAGEETAPTASITINRGEAYVIRGVSPSSEPQVRAIDNPNALIVNKQPDGGVLVLGADAGVAAVVVTTTEGRVATYRFTVQALIDPKNPLAPGAYPEAASEPLDRGAGPLRSGSVSAVGESAPAVAGVPPASESPGTPSGAGVALSGTNAPAATTSSPDTGATPRVIGAQGVVQQFETNPPALVTSKDIAAHGPDNLPDDTISMRFGTSRLFNFARRIKRVSIANSEIADVQVIDPHQVMLVGRKPGFTTLAVWDDQGHYEERQVRIDQGGHQQVMLNVVVAEVDRNKIENQGVDITAALSNYGVSLVGLPGQVATPYTATSVLTPTSGSNGGLLPSGGGIIPLLLSSNLTYGLAAQGSGVVTQTMFQFLEQHSLARVLAQPELVANSGEEAKFLSGGEIPIVIAQALNTSIIFKQFGTSVVFVPTVIGRGEVELAVKPEVSKPDFTQGVSLFGFTVPAFITQRAETVVRMNDKQTLIIAGLISRDRKSTVHKVPYLGDIPFVGALFHNTSYQDERTELMMTVTPHIVQAIPASAVAAYPTRGGLTTEELRTTEVSPPDASRPRF